MLRSLFLLLPLTLLLGCLTGDNYPKQYAATYCASLFECVESLSDIDTFLGYDDEAECREKKQSDIEGTGWYDAYLEGDRTYDADNGEACVKEIDEIKKDPDCGTMGLLDFGLDTIAEECDSVFPETEE